MKLEPFLSIFECLLVRCVVFLRQIQGKNYKDALILLEFMPYASCEPIIKVLRSAAANAQNNMNLDEKEFIREISIC